MTAGCPRCRRRRRWVGRLAALILLLPAAVVTGGPVFPSRAALPHPGNGSAFLDHDALLGGLPDRDWFAANIPFLEVPDQRIQDVYYYRWLVWREHLQYTTPAGGHILTEFLNRPGYSAAFGGINAAAGHHIYEGRWLREQSYLDDYIRYWLRGAGRANAHQYSFWLASAAYDRAAVTNDWAFLRELQADLVAQYRGWDDHFDAAMGLYWQTPLFDATEYNIASYQSADAFAGGAGFRPTINAYQYGDALAISRIAARNGDTATADEYAGRAAALKANLRRLWDPQRQFFFHLMRDDNPQRSLLDGRELAGLVPWQFGAAEPGDAAAWAQLLDPQGFAAPYGPTTAERRHRLFMYEAGNGCCRWNGPSWPYQTSQVLAGLANLLLDHPAQPHVTAADYVNLLTAYAATQHRNGRPYVAEAHHPDENRWLYDGANHSEDYLHSTYTDLVINGLIGLRPAAGDALRIAPLAPASWPYFALENVPYHGRNVTVLWDRDGTRYGQGAGLRVYLDGRLAASRTTLAEVTVDVAGGEAGGVSTPWPKLFDVNDAANPNRASYPRPFASYTSPYDDAWRAIDGRAFYTATPNTRWTSYRSATAEDHVGVDFGSAIPVNELRIHLYDDGGGVRTPASYRVQYWNGSAWVNAPGQVRQPASPTGNTTNTVSFATVTTSRIRVVAPNPGAGLGWGVVELEAMHPRPVDGLPTGYVPVVNRSTGKCVEVAAGSTANQAAVQQRTCTAATSQRWQARPADPGYVTLVAQHSGRCLEVDAWSTATGAAITQWTCHGGANQQWQPVPTDNGYVKLRNRYSGKFLDVLGCASTDPTRVTQYPSYNNHCQQFRLGGQAGAGAAAAATGTPLREGTGLYPRAIRLAHSGAANGRVLAGVVAFPGGNGVGSIHESTDGGGTFQHVGTVADPQAAQGRGLCCATLFELPRQLGDLPAGTLLWAASVSAQARPMSIRVWRSGDIGRTWSYLSDCATTTGTGGLWEPEFSVAADGRLVCHYSDETDPAHSQKLMEVRSSDGVTWTGRRETVASATAAHRPGMAVVRQLPDGRYLMAYEVCGTGGQYGCAVYTRSSADGWDWGDPAAAGARPRTVTGDYFTHTPTIAWAPSTRNGNGTVLLIGQLFHRADGAVSDHSGGTILANAERGNGYWYELDAPVRVPVTAGNPCQNYSSPLLPSADGTRVLQVATDYEGSLCRAYHATGSAVGTGVAPEITSGGTYRLRGVQGGHCLGVAGDSRADGGDVRHVACTGAGNQAWAVTRLGGGYFALRGANSGRCLAVAGASTAAGADVIQRTCTGAAQQSWQIVDVGRGYVKLVARHSGRCLDVAGGATAAGANVQQWTCNDLHPQIWRLLPA